MCEPVIVHTREMSAERHGKIRERDLPKKVNISTSWMLLMHCPINACKMYICNEADWAITLDK